MMQHFAAKRGKSPISNVQFRASQSSDFDALMALYKEAFPKEEAGMIQALVSDFLAYPNQTLLSSWVAEHQQQVVGHVIFSKAQLEENKNVSASILAPLAVSPVCQKQGIGTQLVNHGLDALKQNGIELCLVYGDPNYYQRFGFVAEHEINAPYELQYPHGWLGLSLSATPLKNHHSTLHCLAPLMDKHYW